MSNQPHKSTSKTIISFILLCVALLLLWHYLFIPVLGIAIAATAFGWTLGIWALVALAVCCILALILPIIAAIIVGIVAAVGVIICIILFPFLFPILIPVLLVCICISILSR